MTDEELAEIEARWAAATKGPWFWQVNQNAKCVTLWGSASMVVMDFVRWGFNKATPRFRDYRDIMEKAEEFAYRIEGREHHSDWCKQITHPDAVAIQSAPNDVSSLIAEVRRLKGENENLQGELIDEKAYAKELRENFGEAGMY